MSFSDFILSILILACIAGALWVMDINPYSKQLQVYNQTCTEMILDNSYCKGKWIDDPVISYLTDKDNNNVTSSTMDQPGILQYKDCSVLDRKNWTCTQEDTGEKIHAMDGKITYESLNNSATHQITRLEWLQNSLLKIIS